MAVGSLEFKRETNCDQKKEAARLKNQTTQTLSDQVTPTRSEPFKRMQSSLSETNDVFTDEILVTRTEAPVIKSSLDDRKLIDDINPDIPTAKPRAVKKKERLQAPPRMHKVPSPIHWDALYSKINPTILRRTASAESIQNPPSPTFNA